LVLQDEVITLVKLIWVCAKCIPERYGKVIEEHEKTIDPDHPRDFIDLFLLEMKQDKPSFTVSDTFLCPVVSVKTEVLCNRVAGKLKAVA